MSRSARGESVPRGVRDREWTGGSRPRKREGRLQRSGPRCTTRLGEVTKQVETLRGDGAKAAYLKTVSVTVVSKGGAEISDELNREQVPLP